MLTSAQRKALKAQAHQLEPVVIVGAKGVTAEVLREIDRALTAHGLIKVRAPALDRDERDTAMQAICESTGANAVQQVGKVMVLYRKRPEEA